MSTHESALDFARLQVQRIDVKMAELAKEKASILGFIETIQKQFASDIGGHSSALAIDLPRPLSDRPGSLVRQFNRQIVRIALEIMREKGEPMSAPELYAIHPAKREIQHRPVVQVALQSRGLAKADDYEWSVLADRGGAAAWLGEREADNEARILGSRAGRRRIQARAIWAARI